MTGGTLTGEKPVSRSASLGLFKKNIYNWLPRLRNFLIHAIGQVRILRKTYPGLMHALIFWGVTIQILGTAINLMQMQLFIPWVELAFPREGLYFAYELIMDIAGLAILLGIGMAFFRRLVLRPKELETRWDDTYALILLSLIPLAGFTLEGLRLLSVSPAWANWSPVGNLTAGLLRVLGVQAETAAQIHPFFFWIHAALGLTLAASIPFHQAAPPGCNPTQYSAKA